MLPYERSPKSRSEQTLIEGEQRLVYFKDIVVLVLDEIRNDDVKLIGVRQRKGLCIFYFSHRLSVTPR